ncbi:MAG: CRTAC1 family protein [Chloroflexi bacterium]|nr:CRTAC1 family protein [Chloroflexota bacterium]
MKTKTGINLLFGGIVLAALANAHAQATFTKITTGEIVTDPGQFASAAWGDFYQRGLLDLAVCNYAGTNVLYRNNDDGTFTKITQGDPVRDAGFRVAPVAADYDNDGYLDLFISAGIGAPTPQRNILYKNNGDGTFTPVGGGGVTNLTGFFNGCAWSDYDNDGFVDLFIPGVEGNSLLFHNNGDGTFTRILSGPIVTDFISNNTSVSWADYDNDGFLDLLINGAQATRNFLYHNNRNGTFTRVTTNAVATDAWPSRGWGASWGDYDNDGLPDLFIPGMEWGNRLYHNNGNGVFTNVASGPMLSAPAGGGSRTCAWGDYDNDGYLDLFVASYNATNRLFHNNGNGTFTQVLSGAPVMDSGSHIYSQACGWADYDNDGFLDLFVTRFTDNGIPTSNLLYHNDGNTNGWLEVKLVGTVANRSAIGAKVRVRATIAGNTFWQMREITTGGGRWAQPLTAHFGLGNATNVDTVRVEWPSGTIQEFRNVSAKQIMNITEPPRLSPGLATGAPQITLKGGRGFRYRLEVSEDLRAWSPLGDFTVTNVSGTVSFTDAGLPGSVQRFYRGVQVAR